ncbi:hypothetical protein ACMFWY_04705 [Roseiconus sp. JC912]|uniref:hypothetical protein n=1 Tax=Roseiconus sp. JC912 TaxID=3396307 RepID=UPI003A4C7B8D
MTRFQSNESIQETRLALRKLPGFVGEKKPWLGQYGSGLGANTEPHRDSDG